MINNHQANLSTVHNQTDNADLQHAQTNFNEKQIQNQSLYHRHIKINDRKDILEEFLPTLRSNVHYRLDNIQERYKKYYAFVKNNTNITKSITDKH